jgi:streptomycin 6-kinase
MDEAALPILDDEVRARLGRRYGAEIDAWLTDVPSLVHGFAVSWELDQFALVRRGTVSLVLACRRRDGSPAVLKVSPDRPRINAEARALAAWYSMAT